MKVEIGHTTWSAKALQYNEQRRRFYKEPNEKIDYIEYRIILHFKCPAEAKHCANNYEHNERLRVDIIDKERYDNERHLENAMKMKGVDGSAVVLESEKAMGELAAEVLSDTPTN